jgi:ABC-type sugar transport system substrate-binding protein
MKKRQLTIASMGLSILLLGATACGSTQVAAESEGKTLSSSEVQQVIDQANANVEKYTSTTGEDIKMPGGEPFDPGNRKLMVISTSQASAASAEYSRATVEAAELAGWDVAPIKDAQFAADKVAGFVNEAINQKFDVIVYAAANPNDVVAAVKAADAAGIVQVAYNSPVTEQTKDIIIPVTPDFALRGQLVGDWVISQSKCEGPVHVFADPAYDSTMTQLEAAQKRLADCGSGLKVETTNIATSDLQKPGPPFWTAALAQSPRGKMPFAVAPYDTVAGPMARALADQGRDDVALTGLDGNPEAVSMIERGNMAVTIASPWEYLGYLAIDLAARKINDMPLYDATEVQGARIVTKDNAKAFTDWWEPEGLDYQGHFAKLWSGSN